MTIDDPPDPNRKANALPPVAVVAREGFRAPNKLTGVIAASHRHRVEITELKKAVNDGAPHTNEADRVGMAIRRWDAQGGSWKLQVLNALLVEAMGRLPVWLRPSEAASTDKTPSKESPERALGEQRNFLQGWQNFLDHIIELDVFDAPSLKLLLDGHTLAQALDTKPGKWTGQALDICMEWQLRNPEQTDPTGAIEEVRKRSTQLGIETHRK
jgi:hypothetical protein